MKAIAVIIIVIGTVVLVAYGALIYYDNNFPFGRMWETPAVKPHEDPILIMETGVVPYSGGEAFYRAVAGERIKSPYPEATPKVIASGKAGYENYCIPCHGINHDGYGTVGQSFYPPPQDIRSKRIQAMPDGKLFKEISYGIEGKRQPPLATTIEPLVRWQIVAYVKSLGVRK